MRHITVSVSSLLANLSQSVPNSMDVDLTFEYLWIVASLMLRYFPAKWLTKAFALLISFILSTFRPRS